MHCYFTFIDFHFAMANCIIWNCSLCGKASSMGMFARNEQSAVTAYVIQELRFLE